MKRGIRLVLGVALLGAACSATAVTTTSTTTPTSTSPPTTAATTTTVATTTITQPPHYFDQVAYFFTGDPPRLVPYVVRVAGTAPQLTLDALGRPPSLVRGATTGLTPDTVPEVVAIESGVASVSLPAGFAVGSTAEVRARLAQVVYTLTRFDEISAIEFLIAGLAVEEVGGVPVRVPTSRSPDFDDLLGPLLIDEPAMGQRIEPPVHVRVVAPQRDAPVRISLAAAFGIVTGLIDDPVWPGDSSQSPESYQPTVETDLEFCSDRPDPGTLQVTMGQVTVTQSVLLTQTPDRQPCRAIPLATSGWEVQEGDLLAASEEAGVSILHDGEVIAVPVTSPVSDALVTAPGEIVVDPFHVEEVGDLWTVRPDGTIDLLYRGHGGLHLLAMLSIPGFGTGRWLAFTETCPFWFTPTWAEDGYGYTCWLVLLNLETGARLTLPARTGEGGYTGIVSAGDHVVMSASAEGMFWFEAKDAIGTEVAVPHNPAPHDADIYPRELVGLAGIPGTGLWTFAGSDDYTGAVEDYLVIYNPSSGAEITRSPVPGSAEDEVMVWQVDADAETVAVTTVQWDGDADRFVYTAHLFDLAAGTWTSFSVPGLVRLVR